MSTQQTSQDNPLADFGPNEWIVDDMYQRYLADPSSVDAAWHDFFADYKPVVEVATPTSGPSSPSSTPTTATSAAPTTAAPAPAPAGSPAATTSAGTASAATPATAPAPAAAPKAPVVKTDAARVDGAKPEVTKTAKPDATRKDAAPVDATTSPIRGAAARIVANMDASLAVPTATSVRAVPAKLLADNRIVINNALARGRGGKVSFTHLIGYALVRALAEHPEMNHAYAEVNGKPVLVSPEHVNLGIAIDLTKPDGSRTLVVPSIKKCEETDFRAFWAAYEDVVRRARRNELTPDDFAGTTISLTNPGGIGTVHSQPRLMAGQGTIIGVGAMEYPAPFAGMSERQLAEIAVSKIVTLTSTYDHRVIQGAQSGEFLKVMHELLLGERGFYDEIFTSLRIPYEPVRWVRDVSQGAEGQIDKTARVIELIHAYRVRGHLMADTDPLEFHIRRHPDLDVLEHGLTLWDLDRTFPVGGFAGQQKMKLRDVLGVLRDSYCRRVGVEYMHIQDPEERRWIAERVERKYEKPTVEEQRHILGRLNAAEAFETFLQTKYVGQRRFSLEGGESLIPLLDEVLSNAAERGLDEVVLGMAHRGRLNVLANIVGKPYEKIFNEFEGHLDPKMAQGSGDVKYHLGMDGKFTTADQQHTIAVSLVANPSHLEAVDPVLEGIVRAKQDRIDRGLEGYTVLALAIHGDAAFAGQGVVAETLNLSQLRGYRTGGTIHVVVNNQVGFTTAPEYSRSSLYSTDVARMIQAPIFHVNGDDPEAVVRVARLALEYRVAFNKDVVIDMLCYRRRGHNEGDDPSMTNPQMYAIIDTKRSVRKLYTEELIGRGDISLDMAEESLRDFQQQLETVFKATRDASASVRTTRERLVEPEPTVATAIPAGMVKAIGDAHIELPAGFTPHKRIAQLLERRAKMAAEGNIDWGFAEIIAFGSLLAQGVTVRLSGQDSRRGTFVQRHAGIVDAENGHDYLPLSAVATDGGRFFVFDSLLSEYAAMGFEYGYSVENPDALVIWEAQFGDFANGGQTVVDEFMSSGEAKWGQRTALTLLLPHGHEGQGPDHTSGRPERYLQLAAEDNIRIAIPSTPANYFHLLRRQALSAKRKPLVVFTPKSLLRHRLAVSSIADFTTGTFAQVIGDSGVNGVPLHPAGVTRVLLCTGKLYYDLLQARADRGITNVAITRVEQLYPLPVDEVKASLATYPNATDVAWVQEEPANQGAWSFIALNLTEQLDGVPLRRISRPAAAAPAVGSAKLHEVEQAAVIEAALPSA
ncbi:MAG TPA: multifunctional oxoglutarate decarboxylase/oxoglutarate dehydrogenase thiamine pyrophosphate-binding subunit/dihydrolipoyllysine-residue succinyltransferase subunit [Micromonosporaceae bacterium]|nr:multifunctional oxoglutarate decarboxylase/oxoglutarate dehydrogenase thiamine pyrophosphate-binding subunit/dihydrolipoyllysine-residue succinyltransferase subunit [Micromonosporaceae bacterium]